MKKTGLLLVVAIVAAVVVAQPVYAGGPWNEAELRAHAARNSGYGYRYGYPNGYYPNGYHNVDVRSRERWEEKYEAPPTPPTTTAKEEKKGERSFEQSPNLKAKVIDAATALGALLIIFR